MLSETRPVRIFVAEDSAGDVLLIREALTAYGVTAELLVSEDGEAALTKLGQFTDDNLPDLIIVDLNLPRVDGMDVLRCVRGLPVFDRTPVLVFTSSHSLNDRAEATQFGANAYVMKPPTLDDFLSTIGSAIHSLISTSGSPELGGLGRIRRWPSQPRRLLRRGCFLSRRCGPRRNPRDPRLGRNVFRNRLRA
jgi:two-component system, chemotaxis family, response regulator Rcp1